MSCETVRQGDPLHWLARPDAIPTGVAIDGAWECKAGVFQTNGTELVAPFTVTDKVTHADGEEYFLVTITAAQTAALAIGTYLLVIQIENSIVSPVFGNETPVTFQVLKQLIV